MTEPVLRISVSPRGLLKVDTVVASDDVRPQALQFYANVLDDITRLDRAIRAKTKARPHVRSSREVK
jgi:hypothetical protein